jgi:hypothetical protein
MTIGTSGSLSQLQTPIFFLETFDTFQSAVSRISIVKNDFISGKSSIVQEKTINQPAISRISVVNNSFVNGLSRQGNINIKKYIYAIHRLFLS